MPSDVQIRVPEDHGCGRAPCDCKPVEVLMEDGTWEPAGLQTETRAVAGHAGLISWRGVTAWLHREQGRGYPNEWRWPS